MGSSDGRIVARATGSGPVRGILVVQCHRSLPGLRWTPPLREATGHEEPPAQEEVDVGHEVPTESQTQPSRPHRPPVGDQMAR